MTNSKYFLPLACGIAGVLAGVAAFVFTQDLSLPLQAALIAIAVCLAMTVPWVVRNVRDRREMKLVEIQFVDFLNTVRMCLMSGLSLPQSIQYAVEGKDGILAGELNQCLVRMRLGQTMEDSLKEFAKSLPLRSVQEFVTYSIVLKETGGNLAEPCEIMARDYRLGLVELTKHEFARRRFAIQLAILTLFPPLVWQGLGFATISAEVLVLVAGCALQFSLLVLGRSPRAVGYRGGARDWKFPVATVEPSRTDSYPADYEPLDTGELDSPVAQISQFRGSNFLRGEAMVEAVADFHDDGPTFSDVEPLWRTEFAPAGEIADDELILDTDAKKIWWNLQEAATLGKGILVACDEGIDAHKMFQRLMRLIPLNERVALVESTKTMELVHEFGIHLVTRPSNADGQGAIGVNQLIQAASNMNVRWLIVPESQHVDLLETLNQVSRHSAGLMMGVVARDARVAISVIESQMGETAALRTFRELVATQFSFVVQIRRLKNGEIRMVQLSEVAGLQSGGITLQEIFVWDPSTAETVATGMLPSIYEHFENQGMTAKKFYSN